MAKKRGGKMQATFDCCDIVEQPLSPTQREAVKKKADWPVHESDASL